MPLPDDFASPSIPPVDFQPAGAPIAARIDWHQPAASIEAFVRQLARHRSREQYRQPASLAAATIGRAAIGISEAHAGGTMSCYPAGTITRCDDELWVQTGRGHLAIDRVVVDGEEHDAARYFVAAGFAPGDSFDVSHRWISPSRPPTRTFRHAA